LSHDRKKRAVGLHYGSAPWATPSGPKGTTTHAVGKQNTWGKEDGCDGLCVTRRRKGAGKKMTRREGRGPTGKELPPAGTGLLKNRPLRLGQTNRAKQKKTPGLELLRPAFSKNQQHVRASEVLENFDSVQKLAYVRRTARGIEKKVA